MTAPQTGDPMRDSRTCNPIATGAPKQGTRPPYVLESADEAPCGSLMQSTPASVHSSRVVMRLHCGTGWVLNPELGHNPGLSTGGWPWRMASRDFPARLIAEGLTEAECRHLSGLSAADAIAWCEQRAKPRPQPGDVVPWAEVEDGGLDAALGQDRVDVIAGGGGRQHAEREGGGDNATCHDGHG